MRYLIISDLHSNLEALEAVFAAAAGAFDKVLCCGDIVGYGPEPNEVLDRLIASGATIIRGNHDRAACGIDDADWFTNSARDAVIWTKAALTPSHRDFLFRLPPGPKRSPDGEFQLVHGSLMDEDEYLFDALSAYENLRLASVPVTFFGHTHMQCAVALSAQDEFSVVAGDEENPPDNMWVHLEKGVRYLINPGSVGQPRDGDPRAAYAIYDSRANFVKLKRAEYDIPSVQAKMRRVRLPEFLIERLALGG